MAATLAKRRPTSSPLRLLDHSPQLANLLQNQIKIPLDTTLREIIFVFVIVVAVKLVALQEYLERCTYFQVHFAYVVENRMSQALFGRGTEERVEFKELFEDVLDFAHLFVCGLLSEQVMTASLFHLALDLVGVVKCGLVGKK